VAGVAEKLTAKYYFDLKPHVPGYLTGQHISGGTVLESQSFMLCKFLPLP
jgi:hypothetical protein